MKLLRGLKEIEEVRAELKEAWKVHFKQKLSMET